MEILCLSCSGVDSGILLPALDSAPLMSAPTVKSLGLILDASFSMKAQVTDVARLAFYHVWLVKQLVPYLSSHNLAIVIHTIVTTRLDY